MDQFTHKTIKTKPFDLTYSYYLSPDFHKNLSPSVPTLLILHGYPDHAHMWAGAMPLLTKLPYPMVVPDLLGFDGSSKPTDPSMYRYKQQADSLAQILEHEGALKNKNIIPIGHDWGSGTAQRFYLYYKSYCIGLSLLSLAYGVPTTQKFDLVTANKETAKQFGYPQWEYWNFFTADDAPKLMSENTQRFYEVNHGNFSSNVPEEQGRDIWMREMFCVPGGMRAYVTGTDKYKDWTVPLKSYSVPHDKHLPDFIARMKRDGFEGPVCYYHSLKDNHNLEDETSAFFSETKAEDSSNEKLKIDVPLLYIGCTGDWVCRTDQMEVARSKGLTPDLEVKVIDNGHWVLYENPEGIAKLISDWLQRRFPVSK